VFPLGRKCYLRDDDDDDDDDTRPLARNSLPYHETERFPLSISFFPSRCLREDANRILIAVSRC